ncbi:MAG: DUF1657 domain-containing protein [Epulopiscium sp.]|nr:DUF1657 domain-containing protein [Candidatus Epulonipiscium sp.]
MPTNTKLEKALAGAQGLSADLKTFSQDTDDQAAKQMFDQLSCTAQNIAQSIQTRLDFVKDQEPQYR